MPAAVQARLHCRDAESEFHGHVGVRLLHDVTEHEHFLLVGGQQVDLAAEHFARLGIEQLLERLQREG